MLTTYSGHAACTAAAWLYSNSRCLAAQDEVRDYVGRAVALQNVNVDATNESGPLRTAIRFGSMARGTGAMSELAADQFFKDDDLARLLEVEEMGAPDGGHYVQTWPCSESLKFLARVKTLRAWMRDLQLTAAEALDGPGFPPVLLRALVTAQDENDSTMERHSPLM